MNTNQIQVIMPRCPIEWAIALVAAMPQWGISSPARQAAFLGQVAHESAELTRLEENLNYSPQRLMAVWPKRFPTLPDADRYAHNPQALGNRVYANRNGNGDEASGDGYRYRGRGALQHTGRTEYVARGSAIACDLLANPEWLLIPNIGARAACSYWQTRGLNDLADAGDQEGITRRINGGLTGLEDRLAYVDRGLLAIA